MSQLTGLLLRIRSRPELMVLLIMLLVIAMLIVPLPTFLVDFLIGLNIVISILIFMGSFYIVNVLNFKSFPSVLLISTLFRLALSISTSRLILLEADAGKIIETFGQFVIQDNLVVGIVIFAIVTVVQFIVITKGSERIAEVAARFSLDAMPGKQMGIDADLRSGVVDNNDVKLMRKELEQESQLFGSFDGAMKFVKGDAIAGIIIIFVNLIGGISVGMAQHDMLLSDALNNYSLLTIGDGLVAQIPALLIAISAGFIVTRVGGTEKNLGQNIMEDLFSNDFTLVITAAIACAIGFLPGFPTPVFLILAAVLLTVFFLRYRRERKKKTSTKGRGNESGTLTPGGLLSRGGEEQYQQEDEYIPETLPVIITIAQRHRDYLEKQALTAQIKKQIFIDFGYRVPDIAINYSVSVGDNKIVILINEIYAGEYAVLFGGSKILGDHDELTLLGIPLEYLPEHSGRQSVWLTKTQRDKALSLGTALREDLDEVNACIGTLLLRHINEFFGIQEAKYLLDDLEKKYPELLKECYRHTTIQKITEVFQRLLQEKISIRNMKLILENLVQWSPKEKDTLMLVEHVRSGLSRYISDRFSFNGKLNVLMLNARQEDMIRQGVRQSSGGAFLNLEAERIDELIQSVAVGVADITLPLRDMVMLVSVDIRRFIKKVLENKYPDLEVISFNEVDENIDVNIIKTL